MEEKKNKPVLFSIGPLEYDYHDIDGLYFMLDRKLSGCLVMMWDRPMNPDIAGTVMLDGELVTGVVNQYMEAMGQMWILGIPLRGLVAESGREYQLHVEKFEDMYGNSMDPQDFTLKSIGQEETKPEYAEHERVALEAAREGIVLLKNEDNVLPIRKGETLNLFGKGVHEFRIGAVGAGKINPRYSINFIEAVRKSEAFVLNEELTAFYGCDEDRIPPEEMIGRAKEASDLALVFLTRAAGENQDASSAKGEFYLDVDEEALIEKVSKTFARTVVILNVGYPVDVTFVQRYKIAGLIYLGFAGMLAGTALLEILRGEVNPSGKLPDTWALDYFDIPASRNFYDCKDGQRLNTDDEVYLDTCYEEDIYVGYRYFTTFGKKAAFPFGYGLSYSSFEIQPGDIVYNGKAAELKVSVKNIGAKPGKEVIQIYVGKPESELEQPERELVFFEKTRELLPGEE
ncbi:MAG: glycoside hydrolase family 3 C-terminal domain-containing protein, partial [Lachnospiraceae bacterium]|nr:glycoside hydrolase family 3 C-terminal domain-containing protein [Lachnospiraceae bacterium]